MKDVRKQISLRWGRLATTAWGIQTNDSKHNSQREFILEPNVSDHDQETRLGYPKFHVPM